MVADINPLASQEETVLVDVGEEDGVEPGKTAKKWSPAPEKTPPGVEPEPEAAPEETDDDGLSEEERKNWGRRAQKRIRSLVDDKTKLATELAARDERLATLETERETAVQRARQSQEFQVTDRAKALEGEIKSATTALKMARESGDVDAEVAALSALTAISSEKVLVDRVNHRMQLDKQVAPGDKPKPTVRPAVEAPRKISERAVQWMADNAWFGNANPEDQHRTRLVAVLNAQMQGEGFGGDEDELFDELDRRLKKFAPAQAGLVRTPPRQQVLGGRPGSAATPGKKQVPLTQRELDLAKKWGITPKRWAEEKLKKELSNG